MYQIRNFWFDNGAIKIIIVPLIKLTLPSSTIILIKDVILNNQISEISRIWKNYDFDTSIKLNVASIKIIAIDETIKNIHQHFNIWKKQFADLGVWNLKNSEKIAKNCLIYFSNLISYR
jgi:hypothetical protein